MFKMMFQIDGGKQYLGLSEGKTWNGWEMPYFTFEVAIQIAKDFSEATDKLVYESDTDRFIHQVDYYPQEEWDYFPAVLIDGIKYYGIGAGSWIWDGDRLFG